MSTEGNFYESWIAIIISFICWCGLYFVTCLLFPNKEPEYRSRVVTVVHGTLAAIQGTSQCFEDNWSFSDPDEPATDYQAFLMLFSLGYFMEDLLWCLYYQTETKLMIAHHVYSCVALVRILRSQKTGGQTTCTLGVLEITNPLLQARWFVRSHGMRETVLFTAVELSFIIMYIVVRIIIGSIISFFIITIPKNSWDYKVLTGVMYIISWLFMVNIAKYFYIKYLQGDFTHRLEHVSQS